MLAAKPLGYPEPRQVCASKPHLVKIWGKWRVSRWPLVPNDAQVRAWRAAETACLHLNTFGRIPSASLYLLHEAARGKAR